MLTLSTVALAVQGEPWKFGECAEEYECSASPAGRFPPDLVTGHTIYASWVLTKPFYAEPPGTDVPTSAHAPTLSHDVPTSAPVSTSQWSRVAQAECIVWTNGRVIDARPDPDPTYPAADGQNLFPGDDDASDHARQDYDHGRHVDSCKPAPDGNGASIGVPTDFAAAMGHVAGKRPFPYNFTLVHYPKYVAVVEKGDCPPHEGTDFRYRGHLDFVDPNGIYHEVQEYDYVCGAMMGGAGPAGNAIPSAADLGRVAAREAKGLFPWTYTGANETDACAVYETPTEDDSRFDLGHKCNGSMQDLFTERLWMTPIHALVTDPAVRWSPDPYVDGNYNFALIVDTCSGLNIDEHRFFGDLDPHDVDSADYLLGPVVDAPLVGVCHDGSSFSFDDTRRGRTVHDAPPHGSEAFMRGNGYDVDGNSTTFTKHRTNCRSNYVEWPFNDYPGRNQAPAGPGSVLEDSGLGSTWSRYTIAEDCYPEDHKAAQIDIYAFDEDPTGLFANYSNELTGPNTYTEQPSTGPDYLPPEEDA